MERGSSLVLPVKYSHDVDGEESGSQSLPVVNWNDLSLSQLSIPMLLSQEGSFSLNPLHLLSSQENSLRKYIEWVFYNMKVVLLWLGAQVCECTINPDLTTGIAFAPPSGATGRFTCKGNVHYREQSPPNSTDGQTIASCTQIVLIVISRVRFMKEERSSSIWKSEGHPQRRRRASSFISYRYEVD